jgi:hypothetical protein
MNEQCPLSMSPFFPPSFRVFGITDLLSQNVPLEDVQHLAGHAEPRTTGPAAEEGDAEYR